MKLYTSYSLLNLNTLKINSVAENFIILDDLNDLPLIKKFLQYNKLPFIILGGGSNVILPEEYLGVVIHCALKGIEVLSTNLDHVSVRVSAGENFDKFVSFALTKGWYGLENLSWIPGLVGGAPIQNIGAYGVEVGEFIEAVEVYDIRTGEFKTFYNDECQFEYRNSIFKKYPHYLVVAVIFKLRLKPNLNLTYKELKDAFLSISSPTAIMLRQEVIKIRSRKLPDPDLLANVGSFFCNPIVESELIIKLQKEFKLPVFPYDNNSFKVSAGWLIENLGLKGVKIGRVGTYEKQALVLINFGGATQQEVLRFAKLIQDKVYSTYQIYLNIEPRVIKSNTTNIMEDFYIRLD